MPLKLGEAIFDGPYRADRWSPPKHGGIFAVLVGDRTWRPLPYRVIYIGKARDFSETGSLRSQPKYWDWRSVAGSEERLYVACYPGATPEFRDWLEQRLIDQYRPECNEGTVVTLREPGFSPAAALAALTGSLRRAIS